MHLVGDEDVKGRHRLDGRLLRLRQASCLVERFGLLLNLSGDLLTQSFQTLLDRGDAAGPLLQDCAVHLSVRVQMPHGLHEALVVLELVGNRAEVAVLERLPHEAMMFA